MINFIFWFVGLIVIIAAIRFFGVNSTFNFEESKEKHKESQRKIEKAKRELAEAKQMLRDTVGRK